MGTELSFENGYWVEVTDLHIHVGLVHEECYVTYKFKTPEGRRGEEQNTMKNFIELMKETSRR